MKQKVFAVYDSKIEAFLNPFHMRNSAEAIRSFEAAANDPKTNICAHSEDYTLMEIGEYDDLTGKYQSYDAHIPLGNALTFKKSGAQLTSINN